MKTTTRRRMMYIAVMRHKRDKYVGFGRTKILAIERACKKAAHFLQDEDGRVRLTLTVERGLVVIS